jgi:hypothetical protein
LPKAFKAALFIWRAIHVNIRFEHLTQRQFLLWGQSWLYGSWIHNYLCNQCTSPLMLWVRIRLDEVYLIQHYVIKFVSDLRQVNGFLWVLRFPETIKLTAMI